MLLEEWLEKQELTQNAFAKLAGLSRYAVQRVIKEGKVSHQKTAERIEKVTYGEVSRVEVMWPDYDIQKVNDEYREKKSELNSKSK